MEAEIDAAQARRASRCPAMKPIGVTVDEACRMGGFGRTTAYGLIKQGKLKSVAIGRRRLVLLASLEALLRPDA